MRTFLLFVSMWFCSAGVAQERLLGLTSLSGAGDGGTAFTMLTDGTGFDVSYVFKSNLGYNPTGDLVQGNDGNFYGMTSEGNNNQGLVFKMTPAGTMSLLKNFDNSTGTSPYGSLIKGTDGNFYGMTYTSGANGGGTIFKITTSGTLTVLKALDQTSGNNPYGSLMQASDGNFYGMTSRGGLYNSGTIFRITTSGAFALLKSFNSATGGRPQGNLVQGTDNALYGMTQYDNIHERGVVFKIRLRDTSYTVLKNLDDSSGHSPYGSLLKATDGYFYGMTNRGGRNGQGTIFKISSLGSFSLLKNLDYATTGGSPRGSLIQGTDGQFYGMMQNGGVYDQGTIFKISASGMLIILQNLYSLVSGANPYGSLIRGNDGAFYGMTYAGGNTSGNGTVFKIKPTGAYTLLSMLPDGGNGNTPQGSLVQASNGYLYGVSTKGGADGVGVMYRLCPNGSFTKIQSFYQYVGGPLYTNSLLQGRDGNFYGMTMAGGVNKDGAIYKMTPEGSVTILKSLENALTGSNPTGSLVAGDDTTFYGMALNGGLYSQGTIFKITAKGKFTLLKNLRYDSTGSGPYGSLVKGADGNFYGMTTESRSTYGTIFKITPGGTLTIIKELDYATSGAYPRGSLVQCSDGYFYGMTSNGGTKSYGTIFKINRTGSTFKVLKNFDYSTTGGIPFGDLVLGSDSTLYGMTSGGGTYGFGTIFKIKQNGSGFAVLRHLNPLTDGGRPYGNLIIQKPVSINPNPQNVTAVQNTSRKVKLTTTTTATPLVYALSTAPKNGTTTIIKDTLVYTPKAGYIGADSVYVIATWGCQKSDPAKIRITVTTAAVTMIKESDAHNTFENGLVRIKALPNPSAASFTIVLQSNSPSLFNLRVLNTLGQVVENKLLLSSNSTLQIGNTYKPGLYIAEVIQAGRRTSIKLIKQAP